MPVEQQEIDLSDWTPEELANFLKQSKNIPLWNKYCEENKEWQPNLHEQEFRNTNLRGVNLKRAVSLQPRFFSGADLSGATFPENFEFDLSSIEVVSKAGRNLLTAILSICFYCWIVRLGTTDASLLINFSRTKIPLVNADILIKGFYFLMPILILFMNLYFVICMHTFLIKLKKMPAFFPDGASIHQKIYPWFLSFFARYIHQNVREKNNAHRPELIIGLALGWFAVPATMLAFWYQSLAEQDYFTSTTQLLAITFSFMLNFYLQNLFFSDHSRDRRRNKTTERETKTKIIFLSVNSLSIAITFVAIFIWLTLFFTDIKIPLPHLYANLERAALSQKLVGWSIEDFKKTRGVHLREINFKHGDAREVFMVNSDLQGSVLKYVDFRKADLRCVNFSKSDLSFSQFEGSLLDEADFTGANLCDIKWRQIKSIKNAKISKAKNLPAGFKVWAINNGAE